MLSNQVGEFWNTPRLSTSSTSLSVGIQIHYNNYFAIGPAGQSCSEESITISVTTILLPPTNDTYGSMAIWLMALWLYRMTIWLMTVWRIPQCWGRLLGHTQGTPTVPRGPVPSSHSAPHDVFSGNARGPKLTLSPMECVRLCYRIKGGSHPFYHPQVLQLVTHSITPSFMAGMYQECLCSHINLPRVDLRLAI